MVRPAMVPVPVMVSVVQVSTPAVMAPDRTAAAPLVRVPMATHWLEDGHTTWDRELTPLGTVSLVLVNEALVVGEERITAPLEP